MELCSLFAATVPIIASVIMAASGAITDLTSVSESCAGWIFCQLPHRTRKIKTPRHPKGLEKSCPLPPRTRTLLTRTTSQPAPVPHFVSQARTCLKTTKNCVSENYWKLITPDNKSNKQQNQAAHSFHCQPKLSTHLIFRCQQIWGDNFPMLPSCLVRNNSV